MYKSLVFGDEFLAQGINLHSNMFNLLFLNDPLCDVPVPRCPVKKGAKPLFVP